MRIDATAKLENIRRSWEAFVESALRPTFPDGSTSGIDYLGQPFNDTGKKEWVQARLLGPVRPPAHFYRQVLADGTRGGRVVYMPQVNIFVRPTMQDSLVRLETLRDLVYDAAFREHTTITVKDYAGNLSTLGVLVLRRVAVDREIPVIGLEGEAGEDVRQWAISADADWIETYN